MHTIAKFPFTLKNKISICFLRKADLKKTKVPRKYKKK